MNNNTSKLLLSIASTAILYGCNSGHQGASDTSASGVVNDTIQSIQAVGSIDCRNIPEWETYKLYRFAGMAVKYQNVEYSSNRLTIAENPAKNNGTSGSRKPWVKVAPCANPVPSPVPSITPSPKPSPIPSISPSPSPKPSPVPSISPSPKPTPIPTITPAPEPTPGVIIYPANIGYYVSGTIVQASDSQLYQCLPNVAKWCNQDNWAYTPATGLYWSQAWALVSGPTPEPTPEPTVTPSPSPTITPSAKVFLAFVGPGYSLKDAPNLAHYNPTFAFILNNGDNTPIIWGTNGQGEKVAETNNSWVSVGGANGPYPWSYETESVFIKGLKNIVTANVLIGVDFDVEGAAVATKSVHTWLGNVVKLMRQDSLLSKLRISITLPDPYNPGLNTDEVTLLKTVNQIVNGNASKMGFDYINKMVFDWSGQQGSCSLSSTDATKNCYVVSMVNAASILQSSFGLNSSQAYNLLGATYMIGGWGSADGCDDQGVCTTVENLQTATKILTQKGVNMFGYWQAMGDSSDNYRWWNAIHTGMYGQ